MLDGEEDSGAVKILWDYSESIGGHCLWDWNSSVQHTVQFTRECLGHYMCVQSTAHMSEVIVTHEGQEPPLTVLVQENIYPAITAHAIRNQEHTCTCTTVDSKTLINYA